MKIISDYPELKGQVFDSVDACATEEKKVEEARAAAKEAENKKAVERDAAKAAVDAARKRLLEAKKAVVAARMEGDKLVAEAHAKAAKLAEPAYSECRQAQADLRKALATYNEMSNADRIVHSNMNDDDFKRVLKIVFGDLVD